MALGGVSKTSMRPPNLAAIRKQRDALIREYQTVEDRLRVMIAADLERGAVGTAAYRTKRLAVIEAELSALQDRTVPQATQLIVNAYTTAGTEALAGGGITATFGGTLHKEALGLLADNFVSELNGAAETVGRRVADVYRQEGLRAVQRQFIEAQTQRQTRTQLVQSLTDRGVTSFVDRAGREWGLTRYAEMVSRTTASEAANAGVVNSMLDTGLDVVEIAVSDPCPICEPYAGNTYSLTGATPGLEVLDDQPPFHPNCECQATASADNFDALIAGADAWASSLNA